jgi:hypothetical protein
MSRRDRQAQHQQDDAGVAPAQEGQRVGVGRGQLGDEVAGGPDEDEQRRGDAVE